MTMPMTTTLRRWVPFLAAILLAANQPAGAQSASDETSGPRAQAAEPSLVLDGGGGGFAVLPPSEYYRVAPVRVESGPQIDGRLDEEVWLQAAVIDEFVQQEPAEGEPATERTVVRLLYDAQALYIGVEAYDTEPDGVIATEMRRDSLRLLDEDNFQVILDTFHDRRSGYMFVTSPLGAKLEQQVAEEGEGGWRGRNSNNVNINWDGVWDVVSHRTADGWVAEIAIPMVTLRFPRTEQQVWGVNFMRNIRRKNEQVFWAPISKEYTLTRVSLAGTMTGITGVNRGMDLRLTPYALAGGRQDRLERGFDGSGFNNYGLDVKYGIASGLNLDLTLNTDFAQVEVDEQQVNLTRFPLFFPEKRDFFLENAGMFNVGARGSGFGRMADLFFTRRIGLSDRGQPIPIVGGARLTGKVNRHNVAAMNITTQSAFGNPGDSFFVGRYSRDILARSKVGGIVINKGGGGRDGLQPDVRRRHDARPAPQPDGDRVPGEDGDPAGSVSGPLRTVGVGRRGPQHGRVRARAVAEPLLALPQRVRRPAGTLQPGGRLRPAHRHPHVEVPRRVEPAGRTAGTSGCSTRCGTSPTPPTRTTGC